MTSYYIASGSERRHPSPTFGYVKSNQVVFTGVLRQKLLKKVYAADFEQLFLELCSRAPRSTTALSTQLHRVIFGLLTAC